MNTCAGRRPFWAALLAAACLVQGCTATQRSDRAVAGTGGLEEVRFNEDALRVNRGGFVNSDAEPHAGVSFDEPRSMLTALLARIPPRAVVYPTERYYYYTFRLGHRRVSGNLRFADAEDGRFSIGYFDVDHQADVRSATFARGDPGVAFAYDADRGEAAVTVNGVSRTFVLDRSAFTAAPFALYPSERHISGIRDESGYFLHLLYWPEDRSFYYVLDESRPLPETLRRIAIEGEGEAGSGRQGVWMGDRSRFCFWRHPPSGRLVLVGVHRRQIALNTMYDGPFDQVPPRLGIGPTLREAYPYVEDAGGIDEHGNFLDLAGQRIAISPYLQCDSSAALLDQIVQLTNPADDSPAAWTRATYEYKKDWRAPGSPADPTPARHEAARSVAWPANHWGPASAAWPAEHHAATSRAWPPNHAGEASGTTDPAASPEAR